MTNVWIAAIILVTIILAFPAGVFGLWLGMRLFDWFDRHG